MSARLLPWLANAFLIAFSIDAGFSLVEEGFRQLTGSSALLYPRNALAGLVVVGSLAVVPAMLLTPRLPVSVLAPPALAALWLAFGAAPMPLLLEGQALAIAPCALQLALGMFAFLRARAISGGRGWLLGDALAERPAFSLGHSLVGLGAVVVGGIAVVFLYLPLMLLSSMQLMTDGFVRFDLTGVSLADRRFERDGQEIRLVGMMHIGERDAYADLVESFSGRSTIVLAEGVTDREDLMQVPFSHEGAAGALGLDTQDAIESYLDEIEAPVQLPDVRHADVDLSDFHPDTITVLGWAGEFWDEQDRVRAITDLYGRFAEDPGRWGVFSKDVLTSRNDHLLDELRAALTEYERVIVPWGALHLPFVQSQVMDMGFEPTTRSHHPLASWKTILTALRE